MIINQVFRLLDDVEKNKTGIEMFEMYIHSVMMVFYCDTKNQNDSLRNERNRKYIFILISIIYFQHGQ